MAGSLFFQMEARGPAGLSYAAQGAYRVTAELVPGLALGSPESDHSRTKVRSKLSGEHLLN